MASRMAGATGAVFRWQNSSQKTLSYGGPTAKPWRSFAPRSIRCGNHRGIGADHCTPVSAVVHLVAERSGKSAPARGSFRLFAPRAGRTLVLALEFAMFRIGQHCCPNCDPRRAWSAAGGQGRVVGRRQKSSQRPVAARRLPPGLNEMPERAGRRDLRRVGSVESGRKALVSGAECEDDNERVWFRPV